MSKRHNLHDALERHSFDHAVITTFTFDPAFFEEYCIERFKSLSQNANVTVMVDRWQYDALLAGAEAQRPQKANLRYLLHPISVPGAFHPKVFLFATKSKGLLVIGSANFTRPGLTANAELVGVYNFELEKAEQCRPLFQQAFKFLQAVAHRWPSETLASNLQTMVRDVKWLEADATSGKAAKPQGVMLLSNLDRSLWDQLIELTTPPVDALRVVSRYFDQNSSILDRVFSELKPKQVTINTQNYVTTLSPVWLDDLSVRSKRTLINLCIYRDDEHVQALHAKALCIEKGKACVFAFGSANFTTPALLKVANSGNVEVMVVFQGLACKDVDAQELFDPGDSAVLLKKKEDLRTATVDSDFVERNTYAFHLDEVILDDSSVRCKFRPGAELADDLVLVFCFNDTVKKDLRLERRGNSWHGKVDPNLIQRVSKSSTVVFVRERDDSGRRSNSLLLTNLQDVKTGQSVRRERYVREAEQSAMQFAAVLNDLIRAGDDATLLAFLNFCDIPTINLARPRIFGSERPQWEDMGSMRSLGSRNLHMFNCLHDAAVGFIERHFKRLCRQTESPCVEGIPNFMHISLAIAGVIRSQIERLILGIQSGTDPISSDAWFEYRDRLDKYLHLFRTLVQQIADEYLPALYREYRRKDVWSAFEPDLDALRSVFESVLVTQDRILSAIQRGLMVARPDGSRVVPPIFDKNIISSKAWPTFRIGVGDLKSRILMPPAA